MKHRESARLTAEQKEAMIRFALDDGARDLALDGTDTESRIELEIYVVKQDTAGAA